MEKTNPVDAYIEKHSTWKNELQLLRSLILTTELEETLKWGSPVYTLQGKNVLGLGAFKHHFGIWFFNGALLEDHHKILVNAQEGKTKALRQWRFGHIDEVDEKRVLAYVKEAIVNQREGRVIQPAKDNRWTVPEVLSGALQKDKRLSSAYADFSLYKQKEFAEYIGEAKQEATRKKRLEKIIPMILGGTGLNDKYRK